MHSKLLDVQQERDNALEKRDEVNTKLQAKLKEKGMWIQRHDYVQQLHKQELKQWSEFKDTMEKSLEKQVLHHALEKLIDEERHVVCNELQNQFDNGNKALQEAKQEIQETKMILMDMEKKKRTLASQLRQAQGAHEQLLARERSARATVKLQHQGVQLNQQRSSLPKPSRRRKKTDMVDP
ncbi:hypothetical protein H310_01649 [Aphanomyces invadans]|uniref:Uncharacterized protein n=1 Tax=Aphanomyces invadans TaxID=157072 RepID=A0A024USC2_9STRA|nr:hypothetical protein H310_01649 [Aphanomyces invadans]ETW09249.1 hypothetical protein H310_01649 [Aphanomyces invadans]|eukprot:XP_008863054.1 hypothetical protein H310_01649 [Aphanomyces invadans]